MDDLPAVVLLQVLRFLDHSALHAAEQTSLALLTLTRDARMFIHSFFCHVVTSFSSIY